MLPAVGIATSLCLDLDQDQPKSTKTNKPTMKKLLILAVSVAATIGALAQGTVNFANAGAGGLNARIFGTDGTTALAGTGYIAQLWAGASAGSMNPITPTVTFGTGANAGYFFGGSRTIPTVPAGSPAFFQVRVWEAAAGASWDVASVRNGAQVGGDTVSYHGAALGPYQSPNLTAPPSTPPNLLGLQSFSLYVVPEPSTIALGVLGLAGLLVLRRRK
jgi:hypothetical protein